MDNNASSTARWHIMEQRSTSIVISSNSPLHVGGSNKRLISDDLPHLQKIFHFFKTPSRRMRSLPPQRLLCSWLQSSRIFDLAFSPTSCENLPASPNQLWYRITSFTAEDKIGLDLEMRHTKVSHVFSPTSPHPHSSEPNLILFSLVQPTGYSGFWAGPARTTMHTSRHC